MVLFEMYHIRYPKIKKWNKPNEIGNYNSYEEI